jgi:hypothetical protein
MKPRNLAAVLLICLLTASLLIYFDLFATESSESKTPDIFVGIDIAYDNLTAANKLIDEASAYTNVFVIGSRGITHNITKLDATCQYLYDKGLSFFVYREHRAPQTEWLEAAKEKWGESLLGFYAYDEVGGWQLDNAEYKAVYEADNITHAASQFVTNMNRYLRYFTQYYTDETSFPLVTSDYALYWFDYKAGYDTIFAEFGWNYSRQLNVALCRGAATIHNKDWGVMITWTYNNPPHLESGAELYEDMILAYNNGAKYILVFDTNKNYTQGILKEEHLEAMKKFWNYAKNNPRTPQALSEKVGYVLPKDYAYGFRGPSDKIWGFWEADTFSDELCINLNNALTQYGTKLDVIYDDGLELSNAYEYSRLIFWNGTVYVP